jgi:hypothetical protein
MNDTLFGEMLGHAPRGQFVILWRDEAIADGLEGEEEASEVSEVIEGFGFWQRNGSGIVMLAQLDKGRRGDGAFEVEMEFSLGQAADERLDIFHGSSLGEFTGGSLVEGMTTYTLNLWREPS